MDFYQQYDYCYVISLCSSSNYFTYWGTDLQHLNFDIAIMQRHKVKVLRDSDTSYAINQIENLYKHIEREEIADTQSIHQHPMFPSTAMYFKRKLLWGIQTQKQSFNIERLYFVFIIPNTWARNSKLIEFVMVPVLKQAGFNIRQNYSDCVTFMTELEASLLHIQLVPYFKDQLPNFIEKENRCLLFDFNLQNNRMEATSTFFQLKEDYDLKLFKDCCHTPKIKSTAKDTFFLEIKHLEQTVKELICTDLLNYSAVSYDESVSFGRFTEHVLQNLCKYIEDEEEFIHEKHTFYPSIPSLGASMVSYVKSEAFLHRASNKMKELLSDVVSKSITYIVTQSMKIQFIRKSLIVNEHIKSTNKMERQISKVFFCLLKKALHKNYSNKKDESAPYFFVIDKDDLMIGSFLAVARKVMVSNIALQPVICHSSYRNFVNCIVYIEATQNSIFAEYEIVNNDGLILEKEQIYFKTSEKLLQDSKSTNVKKRFFSELEIILELIYERLQLTITKNGGVSYIFCFEQHLTHNVSTLRNDTYDYMKKRVSPRSILFVAQGEKSAWCMLQKNLLKPPSYYVHCHMEDDHLYLWLYQVVDISKFTEKMSDWSTILVKDVYITQQNAFDQVAEAFWCSLGNYPVSVNHVRSFETFKKEITRFIKKIFINNDCTHFYDMKHNIQVSENNSITFSIQQLIDTAIIPTMEKLVSMTVSSLIDTNIFGHYTIATLFVTGSFLRTTYFSNVYHYIIVKGMEKKFNELVRERSYRTQVDIHIDTCIMKEAESLSSLNQKSFSYEIFERGQLCTVSSATYIITRESLLDQILFNDSLSKLMIDQVVLCSFEEDIDNSPAGIERCGMEDRLYFQKFTQRHILQDKRAIKWYVDHELTKFEVSAFYSPGSFASFHIEALPYMSCIKITCETYAGVNGKMKDKTKTFIFGERQTLRYFGLDAPSG